MFFHLTRRLKIGAKVWRKLQQMPAVHHFFLHFSRALGGINGFAILSEQITFVNA